jgi:hypothetical protein
MRLLLAVSAGLLVSGSLLQAQSISFGVQGGVLLTSPSSPASILHREDKRYTMGPLIELGLPAHFAVEFSPLYKRFGYSQTMSFGYYVGIIGPSPPPTVASPVAPTLFVLRERVNAWEFPIVGKYYFGNKRRPWRPFVLTGYSFTKSWTSVHQSGSPIPIPVITPLPGGTTGSTVVSSITVPSFPATPLGVGAVFGGGIAARKGPAYIGPEFRYTRNGVSGPNQAEVLISVRF